MPKWIIRIAIWYNFTWSKIYRWWDEKVRKVKLAALKPYDKFEDLNVDMDRAVWDSDKWKEMGDATADPRRARHMLDSQAAPKIGDCDEFATLCCATLDRFPIAGIKLVGILTITYWKPGWWIFKKIGGHHVCLIEKDGKYGHIGNWGPYMDYEDIAGAVTSVSREFKLLSWHLWLYPDRLLGYDNKLPV